MPQKKPKNIFTKLANAYRGNWQSAWGDGNTNKGAVRSFKKTWRAVNHNSKKYKYSKAKAVGDMVRIRGLNGPEMNVVFFGWPILVNSFVTVGINAAKNKKAKKGRRNNVPARRGLAVRNGGYDDPLEVQIDAPINGIADNGGGGAPPPLRSGPYSDKFVAMQLQLIRMGMSREMATRVADGEFEGEELADHLSDEELEIFAAYLERFTSFDDA